MATRKQRARKHARRVQHGLVAHRARHEALATVPDVISLTSLHEHMGERGYEQDEKGKWRRIRMLVTRPLGAKRGPVLKRKKRRR